MTNLDNAVDYARTLLKSYEFGYACFQASKQFNIDSAEIARELSKHSAIKRTVNSLKLHTIRDVR